MAGCASKMMAESGFVGAFYSGFVPILFKQIPYTMAKFAVQGQTAESIYASLGASPENPPAIGNLGVSLASGVVAGVAAAIISHPADTLLSKINKGGAGGSGGMFSRMGNIVAETGFYTLCTVAERRILSSKRIAPAKVGPNGLRLAEAGARRHAGPRRPMRHDRDAHGGPVRHLRHHHGHDRRQEVPVPRSFRALGAPSVPFILTDCPQRSRFYKVP